MALVLFTTNWAKSAQQSDKKLIEQLISFIHSQSPGIKFSIKPGNCNVIPVENNRFNVIIKNSSWNYDFSWASQLLKRPQPGGSSLVFQIKEMLIVYGPDENYFSVRSINGVSLELDFSVILSKDQLTVWGFNLSKVRFHIGKMAYQYPDIHELVKSGKKNFLEAPGFFGIGASCPMQMDIKDFQMELTGSTVKKDRLSILLDIGKIDGFDTGFDTPGFSVAPNSPPPDFKKILETGEGLGDSTTEMNNINLTIKKNGSQWGSGTIDSISHLIFLKAYEPRDSFKLGMGIGIKNLKLSTPGKKKIQLLTRLKELYWEYSINSLSPQAVTAFNDLIRKSYTLGNSVDGIKELMPLQMKAIWEFAKSKAHIQVLISPFKHYFGEMEFLFHIRLYDFMQGPVATMKVDIFEVDNILDKLKEANVFSPDEIAILSQLNQAKNENGNISLIRKMDIYQLMKEFLKMQPLLPPTSHKPSEFLPH
jgi:hypothetical protein